MAYSPQIELTSALRAGIAVLTTSAEWERYLMYQSAFHSYSFGNVVLIASQRPSATRVAGFATWRSLGRWVRKGETAIWILAPIRRRGARTHGENRERLADERERPVGFRRVAVFDIAQTDGLEAPEVVHRLTGDYGAEALPLLVAHATRLGYAVELATLDGVSNGECDFARRRISIERSNSPAQRTKTIVHELAHAMLHEFETDRALAELEAESVAFIVCRTIGLDTGAYTFGYVASWAGGGEAAISAIRRSGERIARTANALAATVGDLSNEAIPDVERDAGVDRRLGRTA